MSIPASAGERGAVFDWAPAPGAAPRGRMLAAQARLELRLLLRNGEQVGLTLLIPLLLLVFFNLPILYSLGGRRIDFVVPSIMALSVMSASFTGLAIGTGFERKYGVLKRLGGTALSRADAAVGQDAGGARPRGDPARAHRGAGLSRSVGIRTAIRRWRWCSCWPERSPSVRSGCCWPAPCEPR